ncbi:MAG: hypothetical protein HRU23_16260 [Gammaproteobacteria bacterium]|nr:hypothetical protein [Gammaproteobacteria bacterium]
MKWSSCFRCLVKISVFLVFMPHVLAEQVMTISKVESATVFNVRLLSEQDLRRDQRHNWRLFGESLLGGVLGYQFGEGSAVDIKQVLDAILLKNKRARLRDLGDISQQVKLIEMIVILSSGVRKAIILPLQKDQVYRNKDRLRLVYFETGVFIDRVL